MIGARLSALSLVLVALLHGVTSGRWVGSGAAALVLAAAVIVPVRLSLGAFAQLVLTLVAAAAGGGLGWLEAPEAVTLGVLGRGWSVLAVGALFAAAFRSFLRAPAAGPFGTFALGLVALVAAGEVRTGSVYPIFVVGYLLCGMAALRGQDEGRARLAALSPRGWAVAGASALVASSAAVGLAVLLPPVALHFRDSLLSSLGEPMTGLGERMVLGSLEGMLQSDEIVARVYGPPVDYLRGVVYDHYQAGQWAASTTEGTRALHTAPPGAPGPRRVRVVLLGASRTDRYLLPLGAQSVSVTDGPVMVDRFGTLRPARGAPYAIEFDLPEDGGGVGSAGGVGSEVGSAGGVGNAGGVGSEVRSAGGLAGAGGSASLPASAGDFPPVDPTQDDLRRPVKLARDLAPLVRRWAGGAATPEERVEAIAAHLRSELRYSLSYERGPGDPLLDFLTVHPEGHCEYFASAMAMLARSAGVPARVVAGYRVSERNELGGYSIVRRRNAHAWVEVHLPGRGWVTVDATPDDLLAQNRPHATPFFAALWDLAGAAWASAREHARAPSLLQIIGVLLMVIAAGLIARWWTQRRRAPAAAEPFFTPAPPPPALVRLERALSRRGQSRAPSETLAHFAARLARPTPSDPAQPETGPHETGPHETGPHETRPHGTSPRETGPHETAAHEADIRDAAALLTRYAALRYGGVGDEAALLANMDACAARLSSAPR